MRILVVGGGAVGLSCAHFLREGGAEVVVIERGQCGQATSQGNSGWITRSLSEPMPAPGVVRQALKWMTKPDSPLLVHPRIDRDFFSWSWRFARSCSETRYRAGTEAMVALNAKTFLLFDELAQAGVKFEMHQSGLLFVALTEPELHAYMTVLRDVQAAGYDESFEVLDAARVRRLEPAINEHVVGGIFVPSERHVRPETLTAGLARHLATKGVDILEDTEVLSLAPPAGRGRWLVVTAKERIDVDAVVVAAGMWSRPLLAQLGVRVPLEAAKGYSMTVKNQGVSPTHALYFMEAKVGCSPFDGHMRLAGTVELAGIDLTVNRERLLPLGRSGSSYLADWRPSATIPWTGLRPVASDGLPIIGPVPTTADSIWPRAIRISGLRCRWPPAQHWHPSCWTERHRLS